MKKINNILVILTIISAYVFLFIDGYYGIDRILFNIEKKIQYPLEIFDIHNYLN